MPFLLTHEPWIPCRTKAFGTTELGLIAVLSRAHELEEVTDASPLVTLSLHRFLLAILHRAFGPKNLEDWKNLFARGSFDERALQAYFSAHEGVFDLLHPERPFYQVRGLQSLYESDGIRRLVFERSAYGASVNVFQHRPARSTDTLTLAEAARAILALQGFVPGGLIKKKDEPSSASAGPLNRGAFVLIRGENLFETLMLNLVVYDPEHQKPIPADKTSDRPSWEQPVMERPLGSREPSRRPHGWMDWLTWQSRRLELVTSDDGSIATGVIHCVGKGLDSDDLVDPMLAQRVDKARGVVAIELTEDRAIWRDFHAFVRSPSNDGARAPLAVTQLMAMGSSFLQRRPHVVLEVFGMRGDQAAIKLTRRERLSIPSAVFCDPKRVALIEAATQRAEAVRYFLTYAIRDGLRAAFVPRDRGADAESVDRIAENVDVQRAYWASLRVPFEKFLEDLEETPDTALTAFKHAIRREAEKSLQIATNALGTGAIKLKGAAIAEGRLRRSLDRISRAPGGVS